MALPTRELIKKRAKTGKPLVAVKPEQKESELSKMISEHDQKERFKKEEAIGREVAIIIQSISPGRLFSRFKELRTPDNARAHLEQWTPQLRKMNIHIDDDRVQDVLRRLIAALFKRVNRQILERLDENAIRTLTINIMQKKQTGQELAVKKSLEAINKEKAKEVAKTMRRLKASNEKLRKYASQTLKAKVPGAYFLMAVPGLGDKDTSKYNIEQVIEVMRGREIPKVFERYFGYLFEIYRILKDIEASAPEIDEMIQTIFDNCKEANIKRVQYLCREMVKILHIKEYIKFRDLEKAFGYLKFEVKRIESIYAKRKAAAKPATELSEQKGATVHEIRPPKKREIHILRITGGGKAEVGKVTTRMVNIDAVNKDTITIGSSRDNDIVIESPGVVSKKQAIIFIKNGKYFVQDNGSALGTFVIHNNKTLPADLKAIELEPHDVIEFGLQGIVKLEFERQKISAGKKTKVNTA